MNWGESSKGEGTASEHYSRQEPESKWKISDWLTKLEFQGANAEGVYTSVVVNNIISNVPRRVSDESEYFVLDNLDFFMWVAAAAPQTGEAYVIIGRRTCLYRTTLFSRESGEFLPTREIAK
ncbi:hypothetical protein TNCV_926751 [Trichonephila clavipes]|nr:hypothetical protein TNCV_926751 [Trichonephila clavipes]